MLTTSTASSVLNGPYPTETPEETADREQHEARAQFEAEIAAQEQRGVPQSFQRPEMDMPTPGRQESPVLAPSGVTSAR